MFFNLKIFLNFIFLTDNTNLILDQANPIPDSNNKKINNLKAHSTQLDIVRY